LERSLVKLTVGLTAVDDDYLPHLCGWICSISVRVLFGQRSRPAKGIEEIVNSPLFWYFGQHI
jgi:hypothetical protein